jgi:hypothetical protein
VTLFQEAASLAEVDQWLRLLDPKKLEKRHSEADQLALVPGLLRDDLMPNRVGVDSLDSDGLWLKDRNGVQLAWGEMSDGYGAAVASLPDILRHLIAIFTGTGHNVEPFASLGQKQPAVWKGCVHAIF